MRKILGVCLLVLLLTGSAGAGEMPNGVSEPPPSQPASATLNSTTATTQETTADGEMPNGADDGVTEAVLILLAALSSLL